MTFKPTSSCPARPCQSFWYCRHRQRLHENGYFRIKKIRHTFLINVVSCPRHARPCQSLHCCWHVMMWTQAALVAWKCGLWWQLECEKSVHNLHLCIYKWTECPPFAKYTEFGARDLKCTTKLNIVNITQHTNPLKDLSNCGGKKFASLFNAHVY